MQLQAKMPDTQSHFRSIVTDQHLRALGSNGTIFAIGDGATVEQVSSDQLLPDLEFLSSGECQLLKDVCRLDEHAARCKQWAVLGCAQVKSISFAQELFDKADTNNDGKLTLKELRDVLREASKVRQQGHAHPPCLVQCFMTCGIGWRLVAGSHVLAL